MEVYSILRRSGGSAEGDPIVLRETSVTRMIFRPFLIDNKHDPSQSVNGEIVFQRKSPKGKWEDHNELPLSKLKATEWIKLSLDAQEIDLLVNAVHELRGVHAQDGLPRGRAQYLKLSPEDASANGHKHSIEKLRELDPSAALQLLSTVVGWASQVDDVQTILSQLQRLDVDSLRALNSLVGITSLKNVLATWEENQTNPAEEFWQKTFTDNAFVLSQVFSFPVLIIRAKAYIGGKSISNTGGHVADFLMANPLTRNAVIVEIKTPQTKLLSRKEYRAGVYSPSEDLTGAVTQALNYRYSLNAEFQSLRRGHEDRFDVFNIRCLVIAGHAGNQFQDDDRNRSFELFRNSYQDVMVVTYDELFHKTRQLIEALEGST